MTVYELITELQAWPDAEVMVCEYLPAPSLSEPHAIERVSFRTVVNVSGVAGAMIDGRDRCVVIHYRAE